MQLIQRANDELALLNKMLGFNFKVGDRIFFEEEVLTIQKLTRVNGWAAYFVNELSFPVADIDCKNVPVL